MATNFGAYRLKVNINFAFSCFNRKLFVISDKWIFKILVVVLNVIISVILYNS